MIIRNCFFFVLLLSVSNGKSEEERIRSELMSGYNPMAFPPKPVYLSLGFSLLRFDMNEKENTLDTDIWLKMQWNDTRLMWTESKNYDVLHFRSNAVWTPDLTLYNNADPITMENYGDSHILCYPDGKMLWIPPAHARAYCTMDMTYWPYDTHKCILKYGSWTHHAQRLNLIIAEDKFAVESMTGFDSDDTRGEWKLISHNVTRESKLYDCCPEEYASIKLELEVQRNSPSYGWSVQCPIAALCLLTVVIFLLPPSSGEKVFLGAITLLINYYMLVTISNQIGHSPSHTPLIVKLLSEQLILTTVSVIISALIIRISKSPHGSALPNPVKNILTTVAPCLGLGGYSDMVNFPSHSSEEAELTQDGPKRTRSNPSHTTWILLGSVIDRICLILFFLIYVILMIQYSKVL